MKLIYSFLFSNKQKQRSGFTLVEILIVVVIIAILIGGVLAIINPARQRDRARDSTIISTFEKIVHVLNTYNSTHGRYPTCYELTSTPGEITNVASTSCTSAANIEGLFTMSDIKLPETCSSSGWNGPDEGVQCQFRYDVSADRSQGCLAAKLFTSQDIDKDGFSNQWLVWRLPDYPRIVDGGLGNCNYP